MSLLRATAITALLLGAAAGLKVPAEALNHHFLSRLLVAPEHKFAFCYMEKVACTQFNHIMNSLNGLTKTARPWMRSSALFMNVSMDSINKENGWFRGIFLRDPAERYLSAFQSKCLKRSDGFIENGGHMCWPQNLAEERNLSVDSPPEERLAAFEESVRALSGWKDPKEGNPHYALQRDMCGGLSSDLHEFDYVGVLDGGYDAVQRQVREMFAKGNYPISEELLGNYFPAAAPSRDHVTNTSSSVDFYYQNPATREMVRKIYARDYELPGMS